MADELVDVCDENNNLTGIQKFKSEAHKAGLWHRAAHIWIYNPKGDILLQLRAKDKELHPDMWDISAAGHVRAGEEPIISGLREIEEEIGLKVKKEELEFFRIQKYRSTFRNLKNNEFHYIYFFKFNGDVRTLSMQDGEVQSIRFLSLDKIEDELRTRPERYVPHGGYWTEVINEIRKRSK